MEYFLKKISLENTRFEKLNNEIDFLGRDGKLLRLVVFAGVNGSGKTNLLSIAQRNVEEISKGSLTPYSLSWFGNYNSYIKNYIDKLIYEKGLTKDDAISNINNKIFTLISNFKIKIDSFSVKDRFKIIFKNEFEDKFDENKLASGEITLLGSIFRLYLEEIKDKLILLDEPEKSLHPHSPFVLSAVKSEQIRLLKRTPEGIKIEKIEEEINGWTIERILQYFMETEHVRDPKTDEEIKALFEMMKSGDINNGSFKERFEALEQRLGYADKDMVSLKMQLDRLQRNENN